MKTLGPYTLLRRLGSGGMGEVWFARREGLGGASRDVAIKMLLASRGDEESARKMLIEEGRLSMRLTNSNIVQVYDVGEVKGTCYMAMEFVDGIDLSRLIKLLADQGEVMSVTLASFIIGEMLKALAYSHELDYQGQRLCVVHRDISPHNVMISVRGEVKLMDFGIARLASEKTSGLFLKGKLRYMPPEQVRGETRQPTVDLFAVGAVLYELLEGKIFRAREVEEGQMVAMVLDGIVPNLEREVPAELVRLYQELVSPLASQRPETARAAHRRLAQWSGYRDAKFDLEDLMARFVSSAAHSGIATVGAEIPTYSAEFEPVSTEMLDGKSSTDIDRVVASSQTGRAAPDTVRRGDRSQRNANNVLALGLALVGLGFGVFGAGAVLGWWGLRPIVSEAESVAAATTANTETGTTGVGGGTTSIASTGTEEGTTSAASTEEGTTGGEDTTGGDEGSDDGRGDTTDPKVTAPTKVVVTIRAPGRIFVEIKLAGKIYVIDRTDNVVSHTVKLKPGDYSVSYRLEIDGSWREAGNIKIPKSRAVALELVGSEFKVK